MLKELLKERSERALVTSSVALLNKVEIKANQVEKSFYDKYKLNEPLDKLSIFGINSFEKIGWADPFPNEQGIMQKEDNL